MIDIPDREFKQNGWPQSKEAYVFADGATLTRTLHHRWRPAVEKYVDPNGNEYYSNEFDAKRELFELALAEMLKTDKNFAIEFEHFMRLE